MKFFFLFVSLGIGYLLTHYPLGGRSVNTERLCNAGAGGCVSPLFFFSENEFLIFQKK